MTPSEIFPVDRWPDNPTIFEGVSRQAYYSYTVPADEATAVMTFSDAGEANNQALPPDRIIVELANMKQLDFERQLVNMIQAVTADLEPELVAADMLRRRLEVGPCAVLCHPSVPDSFLRPLGNSATVATHEAFPAPTPSDVVLLACRGLPGLIVHANEGAGAFILPGRFFKLRVPSVTNSAWDRLLRDDLID